MSYTQANRPMRVETALGADALLLTGLSGVEGVSTPFSFALDLLSEDDAVAAADLLRTPAVVTLSLPGGEERTLHGLVRRFVQGGRDEELTSYQAEIVPWLWFLSLSRECRIHQNLSVPEIVEAVFRGLGHADFELRCTRSYPRREFCVQYRETHLDFVSRLMEEEGIFYFFEHTPERHLLVIADGGGAVRPCPAIPRARMAPQAAAAGDDVVTALSCEEQACTGKVVLKDYDFLQPSLALESTIAAGEPEEAYDYPGQFTAPDEGERYARIRLEEAAALRQVVRGEGTCRGFQSGHRFDLAEHPRASANQAYLLLQVRHAASAGDFRAREPAPLEYRNHFLAIPHSVAFRPPRATARPVVRGAQTALVVGPAGEEVWVDRHGRIKVQFYWDRQGRRDENSSCWVRVSSVWAGRGWGFIQLPRIGQEVIVDFLEGNPDRPIVVGRVYNAENIPPYPLPEQHTRSGVKTRSTRGGTAEHFNEIRFEDKKGEEDLHVHAERTLTTTVEASESRSVGAGQTITVGGDRRVTTGGEKDGVKTGDTKEKVFRDRHLHVLGDAREQTEGKSSRTVVGDAFDVYQGAHSTSTTGEELVKGQEIILEGGATVSVKAPQIILDAGATLSLKVGGSLVVIDASGVTITGPMVRINSGGGPALPALASTIGGSADAPVDP